MPCRPASPCLRPATRPAPTLASTLILIAAAALAACGGGPKGNHTVRLHNVGRSAGATTCQAREFRFLAVLRASDGFVYSTAMVVTQGQTVDVPFDLPESGVFTLRVGARVVLATGETPQELTWSALAMTVGEVTEVHLETGDEAGTGGYLAHSTADGLPPTASDITCTF